MKKISEKLEDSFKFFKEKGGEYKNTMKTPKLEKVVVSIGTGSLKDKKKIAVIEDRLMKITGQKPAPRGAKVSIANFKLREGDVVGYQVTLRGKRMVDFLERLFSIALPRSKDFKGLSVDSIDEMGNFTIGIKEHTIFPESADEDIKDIFGLAITIVTSARNKEEAKDFLEYIGTPLKKK